jgi:cold shock CspA family protein
MKSREFAKVAKVRDAYAFITPDAGGKDIFAHATELPGETIHSGDRVSYIETADHSSRARCWRAMCNLLMVEIRNDTKVSPARLGISRWMMR